jgi:hypothetical protein
MISFPVDGWDGGFLVYYATLTSSREGKTLSLGVSFQDLKLFFYSFLQFSIDSFLLFIYFQFFVI